MDYTHSMENGRCEVSLKGRFTFFDSKTFASILALLGPKVKSMTLNFKGVEFIDSAALGMLLMAKEDADKRKIELILAQPSRQVKKAFNISGFGVLFPMEE